MKRYSRIMLRASIMTAMDGLSRESYQPHEYKMSDSLDKVETCHIVRSRRLLTHWPTTRLDVDWPTTPLDVASALTPVRTMPTTRLHVHLILRHTERYPRDTLQSFPAKHRAP